MENTQSTNIVKEGVNSGVIAGLIIVVSTLLIYVLDVDLFLGYAVPMVAYGTIIGFKVISGIRVKRGQGGFISFGEGFRVMIIISLISLLIYTAMVFLMYNVVDPDLNGMLKDKTLERTEEMMKRFGAGDDEIEEALDEIDRNDFEPFSAMATVRMYAFQVVIGAIFSAIIAGIFFFITKGNAPEPAPPLERKIE